MPQYRLTEAAENDIVDILTWSQRQFGDAARLRYERLIVTALTDIASDPARPSSLARPELGVGVRSWHLRGSRERARGPDGVVQQPRHLVIYLPVDPTLIVVGRLLHDAMELHRHLQDHHPWD